MSFDTTREVRLYGVLAKKFGRVHRLAVATAAEAVRALSANIPGFAKHLREHSEPGYHVWVGRENIGEDDLTMPAGGGEVIRIAPALAGAKKGGLLQTIIGVVLIVVGALTSWSGGTFLMQIGVAMVLGGVAQLLTPTPKNQAGTQSDNKPSYIFNGAANTTAQGNPVPVLYGEMVVGSAVISAGMVAKEIPPWQ